MPEYVIRIKKRCQTDVYIVCLTALNSVSG